MQQTYKISFYSFIRRSLTTFIWIWYTNGKKRIGCDRLRPINCQLCVCVYHCSVAIQFYYFVFIQLLRFAFPVWFPRGLIAHIHLFQYIWFMFENACARLRVLFLHEHYYFTKRNNNSICFVCIKQNNNINFSAALLFFFHFHCPRRNHGCANETKQKMSAHCLNWFVQHSLAKLSEPNKWIRRIWKTNSKMMIKKLEKKRAESGRTI